MKIKYKKNLIKSKISDKNKRNKLNSLRSEPRNSELKKTIKEKIK